MLTVYTKTQCPYCVRAKALLESRGMQYQEVNIESDPAARQRLVDLGLRSVPQIFENDSLYVSGGYQGLVDKLREQDQEQGKL